MESKLKKYRKNLILLFITSLILLVTFELGIESYLYHKQYDEPSALWFSIKTITSRIRPKPSEFHTTYKIVNDEANPFITFRKRKEIKFHPFIVWSGANSVYEYSKFGTPDSSNEVKLDYFGFRNKEDLYFNEKNYTLVVITGGSEAAGWSHRVTIAESLERILNSRFNNSFKVLNLAMHSYSISNEINAYVQLAYHLKPEFVIAYTGFNDMVQGMAVPYNFKKLGLYYYRFFESWLPRLYYLMDYPVYTGFVYNPKGSELIVDNFLRNVDKYEKIVSSNGGKFIVGIQGFNPHFLNSYETSIYGKMDNLLYRELIEKISKRGYIDWSKNSELVYVDAVHTDDHSSLIIAEKYADIIEDYIKDHPKWASIMT